MAWANAKNIGISKADSKTDVAYICLTMTFTHMGCVRHLIPVLHVKSKVWGLNQSAESVACASTSIAWCGYQNFHDACQI